MSDVIQVTEQVEIIEVDETHVEVIESSTQLVSSVNGQLGAVDLDATDVGADPLGSALQAYQDAQTYANTLAQTLADALQGHATNTSNPHATTKAQVGLGNVDNTSDADKPVSTATQAALDGKVDKAATANRIYGTDNASAQTTYSVAALSSTGDTVVRRTGVGEIVTATPTATTHATTKSYVDTADALKVNKAGDTMTGNLNIAYTPVPGASVSAVISNGLAGGRSYELFSAFDGAFGIWDRTASANRFRILAGAAPFALGADRLIIGGVTNATGIGYITGAGFPNGVISAPVGSTYTDTTALNGAIEWKKASGVSNTGWVVSFGDTQERNITPGTLPSGIVSSSLRIQRYGDTVHLWATNTEFSVATEIIYLAEIPAGFKPRLSSTPNQNPFAPGVSSGGGMAVSRNSTNGLRVQSTIGQFRTFYTSYLTSDAWPTTLPGVIA